MPARPEAASTAGLIPLRAAGSQVGWLHPKWIRRVLEQPSPWRLQSGGVELSSERPTFASRSAAVADWAEAIRASGSLPGWRDERVAIRSLDRPLFSIERALLRPLGLLLNSVQANVWCMGTHGPQIWIARRSMSKPVEPGKLDALVAGGIAGFDEPFSTLVRECAEEAAIDESLARQAVAVGTLDLSYATQYDGLPALHREHIYLFDLQLPAQTVPQPHDGEHAEILSMSPAQVYASIKAGGWTREGAWSTEDLIERQGWLPAPDA
jgi:8-oxo-dGTP pyrophosphatase MutT (NUDIX family)